MNRTQLLNSLRSTDAIDLDGFELRYGENDNQGSDAVFLTVIDRDGSYRSIQTLRDAIQP